VIKRRIEARPVVAPVERVVPRIVDGDRRVIYALGFELDDRVRAERSRFLAGVVQHVRFGGAFRLDQCDLHVRPRRLLEEHFDVLCRRILVRGIQLDDFGRNRGARGE
jgi:hypothetical protein